MILVLVNKYLDCFSFPKENYYKILNWTNFFQKYKTIYLIKQLLLMEINIFYVIEFEK
jgi:hypothetical protein